MEISNLNLKELEGEKKKKKEQSRKLVKERNHKDQSRNR